jgi:hypothetical protein
MDEQPQEEVLQQEFEYAAEGDVPQKKKFATTRKAGYVEEEVDVWIDETIAKSTEFLNRYNAAVYALNMLRTQQQEQIDSAVEAALSPALAEQRGNLEGEFENHYRTLEADFANKENDLRSTLEADYRNQLANATPVYAEQPAYTEPVYAETVSPVYEEAVNVEEPAYVAPVASNDYNSPSQRAQEILSIAGQEAADHVIRTLEKVAVIEAEAAIEADEIRTSAIVEAEHVRSTAKAEAHEVLTKAYDEANAAITLKNKTIEERNAIFGRLQMFHKSQEDAIDSEVSSVGYTPLLTIGAAVVTAIAPSVEEDNVAETEEVVFFETEVVAEVESELLTQEVETSEEEEVNYSSGQSSEELFATTSTETSYEATTASYEEDADDADPVVVTDEDKASEDDSDDKPEVNFSFGIDK